MKANELMVGDYLMHNGLPYRVIQVDGIVRDGWMLENGEEDCGEPIPLTPEILEKNGFYQEWDWDIMLMVCDNIIVEIGNNYKLYKDGKMYLRKVLAPLYYVHQLQNALRVCGIEKEIEL